MAKKPLFDIELILDPDDYPETLTLDDLNGLGV